MAKYAAIRIRCLQYVRARNLQKLALKKQSYGITYVRTETFSTCIILRADGCTGHAVPTHAQTYNLELASEDFGKLNGAVIALPTSTEK